MIKAILFDLDGTFADTAPDLGGALNRQLAARGKAPVPIEQARRVASSGARGLLRLGFDIGPEHPDYHAMRDEFLNLYEERLCEGTRLFPGIEDLIAAIETRGMPWGIVTNKAQRFTVPLMKLLGLAERAACVICGDSTAHTKPHPAPMYAAAERIARAPENCVYLGDDERDMIAGRAAGMQVVAVNYGYLGTANPPSSWPADHWIDHPAQLLPIIDNTPR